MALLKKPAGESRLGKSFGTCWNNMSCGVEGPVECGLCGTIHPNRDQSYIISKFMGLEVVEECCGAALDQVYRESGEEFSIALFNEFSENPTHPRFRVFLAELKDALVKASKKLAEIHREVNCILEEADRIGS